MQSKKPLVIGLGEVLWDMLPGGKKAGGAPINFVYHATAMGADGYAISAIGADDLGRELLGQLSAAGISHIIKTVPYPTGTVLVKLKDGIPSYTIVENTAWDNLPLSDEAIALVEKADAVCFGTLALRSPESRASVLALLDKTPKHAMRVFDINLRQHYYSKELIETLLEKANIFKVNDDELLILREMFKLNGTDKEAADYFIKKYNLRCFILTAGDKYSEIFTADETSRLETPKVTIVDTVGAGDAFTGAFIYSLLQNKTLADAHAQAVKTAAFVCTKAGAWPAYDNKEIQ